MSTPHLTTGSQQPPKVEGNLRLYSMEYCPYVQRIALILKVKNLPYDVVNINLQKKPEWYFTVHPEGKVPALDTGSEIIVESFVISDFIDEKYPNPPLYPDDAKAKKQEQELIKKLDPLTSVFLECILKKDDKSSEELGKEFFVQLQAFEAVLATRGTKFFGGDKPGMVDYMLWPWSERKEAISRKLGQRLPIEDQLVVLRKWHEAMLEDAAVKATLNDIEKHWKILEAKITDSPVDYDNL